MLRETRVPGPKNEQDLLHDILDPTRRIGSHNSRRALIGNFAEELIASALDLVVLKTDARCPVCPDARKGEVFYEFKSSGGSKKTIQIYLHRLQKEAEFAEGHSLNYAILEYTADFTGAVTCAKVYELMAYGAERILVLTAREVHALVETARLCVAGYKSDIGWQRNGYELGYYRAGLEGIRDACQVRDWRIFDVHGMSGMVNVWQSEASVSQSQGL